MGGKLQYKGRPMEEKSMEKAEDDGTEKFEREKHTYSMLSSNIFLGDLQFLRLTCHRHLYHPLANAPVLTPLMLVHKNTDIKHLI